MSIYDLVIQGGRVIDPANGVDGIQDVAILDGKIAAVSETLDAGGAQVFDARGKLVVPGLVDLHVHAYQYATPLGSDADYYCLGRGVTTAVDAGSAGCDTFPGFRKFAVERFKTRLLAFLHISRTGLSFAGLGGDKDTPGELECLRLANADDCAAAIEENRDVLVGVKIRLSDSIADGGRNEAEAYNRALDAASRVRLPLMVHHNFSTVPLEECPGRMAPGDVYTHAFHGLPSTIVDPASRSIAPVVRQARERGVLFDIGHGQGSFTWTVAEIALGEGFAPDIISTDLHTGCVEGPAYDMPSVMTKLLHAGMPLVEVIRASTISPARAILWHDRIGTLGVGREADVAVFSLEDVDVSLEDCQSQMRRVTRRIVPQAVWRAGVQGEITAPRVWPNRKLLARQRDRWNRLVIRDLEGKPDFGD